MRFSVVSVLLVLISAGCTEPPEVTPPPAPKTVRRTYRVVSGISMGAIGSAALGLQHPDRFDAIAPLGGPLDAAYLLRMLDRHHTGGLCPLESLEALMAEDPSSLNDPKRIEACAVKAPTVPFELAADLNHWIWTPGGAFDRSGHLRLFHDLNLAFGNLFTENWESPFAPPGVSVAHVQKPPADFCTKPVKVSGLHNREFNPRGTYDAITYCDGAQWIYFCLGNRELVDFCSDPANIVTPLEPRDEEAFAASYCASKGGHSYAQRDEHPLLFMAEAGRFDACRARSSPVTVGLAIDLNGNGRRDYGEPMLNNGQERFSDVGVDGCANAFEDGQNGCTSTANPAAADPNGDDYDPLANPFGTENDWRWSQGEPFDDHGLDGVAGTSDWGEANGSYDLTSGRRRLYSLDARTRLRELPPEKVSRLRFLLDGGVRDLFNFGVGARQLYGAVRALHPGTSGDYRQWADIPGLRVGSSFDPWRGAWAKVPDNVLVLYGKDAPTESELIAGDGDHTGTTKQVLDRISMLVNFAAAQWSHLPKPSGALGGAGYEERQFITSFESASLGAPREFGVYLPPGYDLPENASVRYPVLYLLHGYGQKPEAFLPITAALDGHMSGEVPGLRPMIVVFPSGGCCFIQTATGARDCREKDDQGRALSSLSDWKRECRAGSFFVDQRGFTAQETAPYGASFLELMDVVDERFRTLPAEDRVVGE